MTGTPFHESGVVFREERSLTVAARIGHAPPASCVAPALAPARCCELLLVPPPRVLPPPTYRRAPARTAAGPTPHRPLRCIDRKSTRLNSSHLGISYAAFCFQKERATTGLRRPSRPVQPSTRLLATGPAG